MENRAFRIRLHESSRHHAGTSPLAASQLHADRADLKTLSLVVSRASNAVLILDATGRIEWINNAFTRLSGYEESVAVGQNVQSLVFGPRTATETKQQFDAALRSGQELIEEILQYRNDGTTVWVECELIPVRDDQGIVLRWIIIESDVSGRRQAEETPRAAQQAADTSSRSKSKDLPPVDATNFAAALERMGGEIDLLREHIDDVLNALPQLIESMRQALAVGDAKQLQIAAQRTKSLFSSYDFHDARELAFQIEQDAKEGRLEDAVARVEQAQSMLLAFTRAVKRYLQAI